MHIQHVLHADKSLHPMGNRFVFRDARVKLSRRHPTHLEAPMKRTGSRQRARESIARMIAKIQRLETARHSGYPGIIERLKGMLGAALRTQQGVESNRQVQQGR